MDDSDSRSIIRSVWEEYRTVAQSIDRLEGASICEILMCMEKQGFVDEDGHLTGKARVLLVDDTSWEAAWTKIYAPEPHASLTQIVRAVHREDSG